jgi:hypothetical protein
MQAFREVKRSKGKVISPVDVRHFIPEIKEDHLFAFAPTVDLAIKKEVRSVEQCQTDQRRPCSENWKNGSPRTPVDG